MTKYYFFLFIAIIFEIIATTNLRLSDGFSKLNPSLITICSYIISFYFLALTLKTIPIGIAYAIWSGVGIVLIAIIGYFFLKQKLDLPAILGISFILIGVLIIQLFSKNSGH